MVTAGQCLNIYLVAITLTYLNSVRSPLIITCKFSILRSSTNSKSEPALNKCQSYAKPSARLRSSTYEMFSCDLQAPLMANYDLLSILLHYL